MPTSENSRAVARVVLARRVPSGFTTMATSALSRGRLSTKVSARLPAEPDSRACSMMATLPEYWVNTSRPASRTRPSCSKALASTWLPEERLAPAAIRAPRAAW